MVTLNHVLYHFILSSFTILFHLSLKYRHFLGPMFRVLSFSLNLFSRLLPPHNFKYYLVGDLNYLSKHQSYTSNSLLFPAQNKPEVTLTSTGVDWNSLVSLSKFSFAYAFDLIYITSLNFAWITTPDFQTFLPVVPHNLSPYLYCAPITFLSGQMKYGVRGCAISFILPVIVVYLGINHFLPRYPQSFLIKISNSFPSVTEPSELSC